MSEPTSWRIVPSDGYPLEGISYHDLVKFLQNEGVLVSDSRLRAIADAPKCEHGKIDRHTASYDIETGQPTRCEGAPESRALLGALTKENTT